MKKRTAKIKRKTKETSISVDLDIEGKGKYAINTGIPFLDHMLDLFSKHSLVDLKVKAVGDLAVDYHHTVEDIGLALGKALDKALGSRRGIVRYGWSIVPMDEALSRAAVDLGGRPVLVMETACRKKKIRDFDVSLIKEFFTAFCVQARMNLHITQLYGQEPHHAYESVFKAAAKALRMACEMDKRVRGVPSSKGRI
ncbi:imidazoleglycerol-phosphate dehydratase HisB [Verrucomicrobiota bacterium]